MKNKKSNKNFNNIVCGLICIIIISILVGIFITGQSQDDTTSYFNKTNATSSEAILDEILAITEENYPKTPEEVIETYIAGYKLLYGEKILDEKTNEIINPDIVQIILSSQRCLLSEDLKDLNPLETQVQNVLANINSISDENARIIDNSYSPAIYSSYNSKLATVRVSHIGNGFTQYFQEYELEKDFEDKWRITRWYNTDENYNKLED
ncbi:MAG: DUF6715 family protein [bacterium]